MLCYRVAWLNITQHSNTFTTLAPCTSVGSEISPPWPRCSISPKSQSRIARSDRFEAPRWRWARAQCSSADHSESPAPPGHWRFPRPLPRSKLPPWRGELGADDASKMVRGLLKSRTALTRSTTGSWFRDVYGESYVSVSIMLQVSL